MIFFSEDKKSLQVSKRLSPAPILTIRLMFIPKKTSTGTWFDSSVWITSEPYFWCHYDGSQHGKSTFAWVQWQ